MKLESSIKQIAKTGVFSLALAVSLTVSPLQVSAYTLKPVNGFGLSSTKAATVQNNNKLATATIHVGKQNINVTGSSLLTRGEHVALQQVLSTGHQTIILNGRGGAVGGSFQIGTQGASGLSIPKGVTAIDMLNSSSAKLDFGGDLINAGKLLIVSNGNQFHDAHISAQNIHNLPGALISSWQSDAATNGSPVNLSLSAVQDFVNSGMITSSGNLSIVAGGSIVNATSTNVGTATLSAAKNVNLLAGSGQITNAGLISAASGNVSISTLPSTKLVFLNTGGQIEALQGSINFRQAGYQGSASMLLSSGNFSARSINLNSGQGNADVAVDGMQGVLNVEAHCAHVSAATNILDLGNMKLSGDPTFYNTEGSVLISGDLEFPGQALAIVAKEDILTTPGANVIRTSSDSTDGGSILMVAGANFTTSGSNASANGDKSSNLTILGGSTTGGSIDLTAGGGVSTLSSASSVGNGGDITLVAFNGSTANSGTITVPNHVTITSGGHDGGSNGNVNIIAGAIQGTAVSIGSINTGGGAGGGGNIAIATAQPLITSSNANCSPCVLVRADGSVDYSAGWFSVDWSNTATSSVSTGKLNAPGASVSIFAGQDVETGSVSASGIQNGSGGNISINAGGSVNVNGTLQANGGLLGGSGGSISVWSNGGDVMLSGIVAADGRGISGNGGWIDIGSGNGNVSVFGDLSSNASGSASGGSVWVNSSGNLFINGSVTAEGAGTGDGGNIGLTSNSSNSFIVGGATVNGVAGVLSAQAAQDGGGGSGGSIYISTLGGSGGISVSSFESIKLAASPAGGNGGSLTLDATGGALFVPQGKVSVDGIAGGNGGYISLSGDSILVTGTNNQASTGALSLSANGDGSGQAGGIFVTVNSGDLSIGNQSGQIAASAQPGDSSSSGGYISFSAGNNLTVDAASVKSGTSAQFYLTAGSAGPGNLLVNGSLNADAASGGGGTIHLSCNSAIPFVIGSAGANGVTGSLTANGSPTNLGDGGSISVSNNGTGGITLPDTGNISAAAGGMGGNGGSISLNAGNGVLSVAQGTLSVDGNGNNNNSVPVQSGGGPNLFMAIRPSTACCNGGNITLQGSEIKVTQVGGGSATGTLKLSANGSADGNAGSISVVTQSGDLAIGQQAGQITLTAISGDTYTSSNNSGGSSIISGGPIVGRPIMFSGSNYTGKIFVSAGGNLTVDASSVTVGPALGTNANGSSQYFIAGTSASVGNLLVNGSLSADGSGTGDGGHLVLASSNSSTFVVSPTTSGISNGVEGSITAGGVNGGSVIVATGGAYQVDDGSVQVSGSSGNNGTISYLSFDEASKSGALCCAGAQFYGWNGGGPIPLFASGSVSGSPGTQIGGGSKVPGGSTGGGFDFSHSNGIGRTGTSAFALSASVVSSQMNESSVSQISQQPNSRLTVAAKTDGTPEAVNSSVSHQNDEGSDSTLLPTDLTPRSVSVPGKTDSAKSGDDAATTNNIPVTFISQIGNGVSFKLQTGNMLLAPDGDIVVESQRGKIQIAKGCVALLITSGSDVAVYDLHDSHQGGIKVEVGNQVIPLSLGSQLVLTKQKEGTFEDVNPGSIIAYREPMDFKAANGTRVFSAEFSLVSAISQVSALHQMLKSSDAKDHYFIGQIKRNAAIITAVRGVHGPYTKASKRLTASAI